MSFDPRVTRFPNMDRSSDAIYPSINSNLLKDVINFINLDDRSIFGYEYDSDNVQTTYECVDLSDSNGLRKKIDELTNLNSSLDKYLTECNDRRFNELMDVSLYSELKSKMLIVHNERLPKLYRSFSGYKESSLYNGLELINSYKRLQKLHDTRQFLNIFKRFSRYYEYTIRHRSETVHNVIVLATALHYINSVTDSETLNTMLFNSLRDYFSRKCTQMIKNVLINANTLNLSERIKLLRIFGRSPGSAANHIVKVMDRELLSLSSLVLQKYVSSDMPVPNIEGCGVIYNQASSLGSNMVLLAICKLLNEFILFLNNVSSQLDHLSFNPVESSDVPDDILVVIKKFNEVEYDAYYHNVVSIIKMNFKILKYRMYNILATVLNNVNLTSLKDANDVIKIAMLLRFFIILNEFPDNVDEPILLPDKVYTASNDISKIICILDEKSKLYINDVIEDILNLKDSLVNLEDAIYSRLMIYTSAYYVEAFENISISLRNDTLQRQVQLHSMIHTHDFNMFSLCDHFTNRIKDGPFTITSGLSIPLLNPYGGWTPSSNFLGLNMDLSLGNLEEESIGGASLLIRNYGGVYTMSSRTLFRHFQGFWRIILLQPNRSLGAIKQFTRLIDDFIYANVSSCGLNESSYNSLKKFKSVFPSTDEESTYGSTSRMSSISTVGSTSAYRTQSIDAFNPSSTPLSHLSCTINAIESCYTALEPLHTFVKKNTASESHEFIKEYYRNRADIIEELRRFVYYIPMYQLIQKKMPTMKLLHRLKGYNVALDDDIDYMFDSFKAHLKHVKEFIEAADFGSMPITVKAYLWESAIRVIKDSFSCIMDFIKNDKSKNTSQNNKIKANHLKVMELVTDIHKGYVDTIRIDYNKKRKEIIDIGIYYTMICDIIK